MNKKLIEKTAKAIKKWCKSEKLTVNTDLRHVHPRVYVIGYVSPGCLVVAVPWMDSEPQCVEFNKKNPLKTLRIFDRSLKAGDWCSMAYVNHGDGAEMVAIHAVI